MDTQKILTSLVFLAYIRAKYNTTRGFDHMSYIFEFSVTDIKSILILMCRRICMFKRANLKNECIDFNKIDIIIYHKTLRVFFLSFFQLLYKQGGSHTKFNENRVQKCWIYLQCCHWCQSVRQMIKYKFGIDQLNLHVLLCVF